MRKSKWIFPVIAVLLLLVTGASGADDSAAWLSAAEKSLSRGMAVIGLNKGDSNLLVLTNAGYGQISGATTEAFLDLAQVSTGCSIGARSLLAVHASIDNQLWFSIFRKDTGKLIFAKWTGEKFDQQVLNADPDKILTPEGWKSAASGLIGPNIFSVVSISLTWALDPPWPLLLASSFHDHFCPGVNAGYIVGEYLRRKIPLGIGDKYVFATAPAICPADALQVMFNTTAGKSSGYAMAISPKALATYSRDGARPTTIAMRVNLKADTCTGAVLGFSWDKAYKDTGVKPEEIAPQGGKRNPIFWIARVKMSRKMVQIPPEQLLGYVIELKRFSGKASLAEKVGGGDPYAVAWEH
jgi:formylmethanofuran dehydrogenase subunit E-like metal-binding protein